MAARDNLERIAGKLGVDELKPGRGESPIDALTRMVEWLVENRMQGNPTDNSSTKRKVPGKRRVGGR